MHKDVQLRDEKHFWVAAGIATAATVHKERICSHFVKENECEHTVNVRNIYLLIYVLKKDSTPEWILFVWLGFAFACTFIFTMWLHLFDVTSLEFLRLLLLLFAQNSIHFLFIYVTCFVYIWAITTQLGFRKNEQKIDKQPWENERSKHYLWFVRCMQMIIHFGWCGTCVQKWMKVIALAVFHSIYFFPVPCFSLSLSITPATHEWFKNLNSKQIAQIPRLFCG